MSILAEDHPLFHNLSHFFSELAQFNSLRSLESSALFQKIEPEIKRVLNTYETGSFASAYPEKPTYRLTAWNLERGICFEGIIKTLKEHPQLLETDILLAPETDLGMARTQNRNVAQELARELNMDYFFGPCYLNLAKGAGLEAEAKDENSLGLHGNAIFSRYPLKDFHLIRLPNSKDKMKGREKRIGSQQALVATVCLPKGDLRVVCLHLDAFSSQRHRLDQMLQILSFLDALPPLPTLLGGDFNTMTYNSSRTIHAVIGFWIRVAMGVRRVITQHYPYPDRFFEKRLFQTIESSGFDYQSFNQPGACTIHYSVEDLKKIKNLSEWLPQWCFRFVEWALRENQGRCSFKIDWLAGRHLKAVPGSAQVVSGLRYGGQEISDHDPIFVDFTL